MRTASSGLSFNDRALGVMENVAYRRATARTERTAIFRQRYRGYLANGGVLPNDEHLLCDDWDDVDNVDLLAVYVEGALAASLRVHVDGGPGASIPDREPFDDVLTPYFAAGKRMVNPTRFVIDERFALLNPAMPFITLRLVAMAAEYYAADLIVAAVREKHIPIYARMCAMRKISEPRPYPPLRRSLACMVVETSAYYARAYERYPFLRTSEAERRALFRRDEAPRVAPPARESVCAVL